MPMITLSLPPGINQTYGVSRGGKIPFYKKRHVKEWEYEAGWEIKRQWKLKKPLTGKLYVGIHWFFKRDRDIDGSIKVLLDLLQRQQVYKNDKQVTQLNVKKYQDLKYPRVEVEIERIVE